jgi:hypothetical protein
MDTSWRNFFYVLGAILVIFLAIKFLIPLLMATLGFILKLVLWVGLIVLVVILAAYLFRMIKNRQ